jgi:acetamidase/formamidase
MTLNAQHTIHGSRHHHFGRDNAIAPALTVAPGETVAFETVDSSGGQITPGSTADDVARLDFAKINSVAGPVYVDGAEPGDALKVTLLSFTPSGWGWTAVIPGFGLLADQFPEPALHLWTYDPQSLARRSTDPAGGSRSSRSAGPSGWRRARPDRTASCRRAASAATWTSAT